MIALKNAVFILLAGMLLPVVSLAEITSDTHPWFDSKFLVSGGVSIASQRYVLGAGVNIPDEDIDFGKILDTDTNQTSFSGGLRWNYGEKWSFAAQTFSLDVNGSSVLTEDVSFDDITFKAGSNVKGGTELSVIRGFFGRKFSSGPKHEFGAGLGLHWMTAKAQISGELILGDGTSSGEQKGSASADLPLPNIGFWYWYSPSPRWMLTSRVDWLSASIGDYSGGLWNAAVGAQFQITDHIGLGIEYAYFEIDGKADTSDWNGGLNISSRGPLLSLSANW